MGDRLRIQELRRRVEADPASIAFAQLAEEHRRAAEHEEAVRVSRAGLARYQTYYSARVTLARALLALDRVDEARFELEQVVAAQPDNLAALRTLSEIQVSRDRLDGNPTQFPSERELPATGRRRGPEAAAPAAWPPPAAWHEFPPHEAEMRVEIGPRSAGGESGESAAIDPALPRLESWLESLLRERRKQRIAERERA